MKRMLIALMIVVSASAVLSGCRAEVGVDPDGNASYNLPAAR